MKIQNLLHILSEKYEETDKVDKVKASTEKSKSSKDKEKKESSRRMGTRSRNPRSGQSTPSNAQKKENETTSEEAMQIDEQPADGAATSDEGNLAFDFHAHQGLAVLGVAVIAMGDEIGQEMASRMFGHLVCFPSCFLMPFQQNKKKYFILELSELLCNNYQIQTNFLKLEMIIASIVFRKESSKQ